MEALNASVSANQFSEHEKWYSENRKTYSLICEQVRENLRQALDKRAIHDIHCRSKEHSSFCRKARKRNSDGSEKYIDPLNEITDLAAVRIIVFLREDVKNVSEKIHELYEVFEDGDVSARQEDQTKFGYESRHILIKVGKRQYFGKRTRPKEAVCEIQVRTILQHAWAEMEHDIGYKSDLEIPPDLRRRFSALAGLLEIADTEFERIQRDSLALRSAVKKDLVADITRQVIGESRNRSETSESAKSVRSLIAERSYEQAIDRYSDLISQEPNSVTLYIGRAKAHFLNGSTNSALADLDRVDEMQGVHPAIERLKRIFTSGDIEQILNKSGTNHANLLERANSALEKGEGIDAFDAFCELEEQGYSRPFSLLGKSMALTLESDFEGAFDNLSELRIIDATPMKVNVIALQQIMLALDEKETKVSLSRLKDALAEVKSYTFKQSPLRYLESGLKFNSEAAKRTKMIFACLPR